jgi:hypothetical protein
MSNLVHCVPFLWPQEEYGSANWLLISLASVFCGDFCWGLLLLFLSFSSSKEPSQLSATARDSLSLTVGFLFKFHLIFSGH